MPAVNLTLNELHLRFSISVVGFIMKKGPQKLNIANSPLIYEVGLRFSKNHRGREIKFLLLKWWDSPYRAEEVFIKGG